LRAGAHFLSGEGGAAEAHGQERKNLFHCISFEWCKEPHNSAQSALRMLI
jgi:hypothetical protein